MRCYTDMSIDKHFSHDYSTVGNSAGDREIVFILYLRVASAYLIQNIGDESGFFIKAREIWFGEQCCHMGLNFTISYEKADNN